MKLTEIQELIKFVVKSGASEITYEVKGLKLTIKAPGKNSGEQQILVQQAPVQMVAPTQTPQLTAAQTKSLDKKNEIAKEEAGYVVVKSPMIGTFYRSSSPDKPAFVNIGDEIKKGQTICIIEAMKLFNEIDSEFSGKIVKVLIDDSTPVEYDQPLFLIDPK